MKVVGEKDKLGKKGTGHKICLRFISWARTDLFGAHRCIEAVIFPLCGSSGALWSSRNRGQLCSCSH